MSLWDEVLAAERVARWRTEEARRQGVVVADLLSDALHDRLVLAMPGSLDALRAVDGMDAWLAAEYGAELVALLGGWPGEKWVDRHGIA